MHFCLVKTLKICSTCSFSFHTFLYPTLRVHFFKTVYALPNITSFSLFTLVMSPVSRRYFFFFLFFFLLSNASKGSNSSDDFYVAHVFKKKLFGLVRLFLHAFFSLFRFRLLLHFGWSFSLACFFSFYSFCFFMKNESHVFWWNAWLVLCFLLFYFLVFQRDRRPR